MTIQNSGCAQEVGLKVRLTIQQSPRPITAQRTIDLIDPGDEATVEFTDLGLPDLDQRTSLTVEVEPVPTESNTANNDGELPRAVQRRLDGLAGHRFFDGLLLFGDSPTFGCPRSSSLT